MVRVMVGLDIGNARNEARIHPGWGVNPLHHTDTFISKGNLMEATYLFFWKEGRN